MRYRVREYLRQLHHKPIVRAITTTFVVVGLPGYGAYSTVFGVQNVKLDRVFLPIGNRYKKLRGLKIAQISDLHFGPTNKKKGYFEKAVDMILSQKPDLITLTGDYYQWDPGYVEELPKILSRLKAPLGVYGVFGNHDYGACYPDGTKRDPFDYKTIRDAFLKHDIYIFGNRSHELSYHGQKFNLVGVHDLWSGIFDPMKAFQGVDESLPSVLMCHNPDAIHKIDHDFDLMLSGHLHGGQPKIPLIGSVSQQENQELRRGLYKFGDRKHLYINRGLGHTFRLRVGSRPEVTLIEVV